MPGKEVLQPAGHGIEFVVVDVVETPVERPKKKQKAYCKSLLQRQEEAAHRKEPGRRQRREPASHLYGARARPRA